MAGRMMIRLGAAMLLLASTTIPLSAVSNKTAVIGSQHDFTPRGTSAVKSAVVQACVFCHAPHNASGMTPLWDHALSTQSYSAYTSSTYTSGAQTPAADSSRLCLSCHDGTVAVGLTVSNGFVPTAGVMASIDAIGGSLFNSHPVSMTPVDDGSLVRTLFGTPAATRDRAVQLVFGKVECTTCHDPHTPKNDPANPMFLVRSNSGGALCTACHDSSRAQPNFLIGWNGGAHATATNTIAAAALLGPYGTVGTNACSSCHGAHNNAAAPRNLKAAEESACTPCHSSTTVTPALLNVSNEFTKTYAHPTFTVSGVHDPTETMPVNTSRHAECADCHNPHATYAQTGVAIAPAVQASLTNVIGYDTSGRITPAATEFQVCYRCHADSTNKPRASIYGRTAIRYPAGLMPAGLPIQPPRPADQYNLRLKFTSTIGHNVAGFSTVTTSNLSLRPYMLNVDGATNNTSRPLTPGSQIYCSDCHNNNAARSSGGVGPNGPHGSTFPHLLQFNLFQDASISGVGAGTSRTNGGALCGKCHNLTAVQNESPHDQHTGYGCTTCHDPHGVIGGTAAANHAMINFDIGVMGASSSGYFGHYYTSSAQNGCYTLCHGENHNSHSYRN
jgi:predicted CXXCH cytochrome family protein